MLPLLFTPFIHQLQLPPGCHVKNVRHPQHRRRMQKNRMLHQPANGEFEHSSRGLVHQRQQQQPGHGQNTPFGQLLQQMRQQRQHGISSGGRLNQGPVHGQQHHQLEQQQQQQSRMDNQHAHRHQLHRNRAVEPKEMGNEVDDQLNSVVHHTPRRTMHRQWIRNHPSKLVLVVHSLDRG